MNRTLLVSALFAAFALAACDKPTVVNVPTPVAVPGPAGPSGATGNQGAMGAQGKDGKPGEGTTVNVMPAASAPAN